MTARQKVLIVDDRKENLIALRQVLSDIDVEVIEATSGNDALTATLEHKFCLAILDVNMPKMDGYELAKYLRGDDNTRQIPIIFASAEYTEEAQIFKGYEVGGIDYIIKPIVPAVLLGKIRIFLELARSHDKAIKNEQQLRFVSDHVPVMIAQFDNDKRFLFVNKPYALMVGYRVDEIIGQYASDIMSEAVFLEMEAYMDATLAGEFNDFDLTLAVLPKGIDTVNVRVSPNINASGQVTGLLTAISDITKRKKVEQSLLKSTKGFKEIVAKSDDAILVLDEGNHVVYVNPSAEEIFQRKSESFINHYFGGPIIDGQYTEIDIFRKGKESGIGELHSVECMWMGGPGNLVTVRDITERKEAELGLMHLAHTDQLTGLANRTALYDSFMREVATAKRTGKYIAVMMLDLDKFKLINDTYGHEAGDRLLMECAQRIKDSLRETDIAARLGGDEFVVMATNLDTADSAAAVAEKITKRMQDPFVIVNNNCSITLSCGVAIYPKDGANMEELLANADAALMRGKAAGRNQYQFYDDAIHQLTIQARELDNELKIAIKEKQFVLYFQPQFDNKVIVSAEALIRWNHPSKGLLYPDSFLSALMKMDFKEVELWTISKGLQMLKAWQDKHKKKFHVSVNLSAPTLQDPNLPAYVDAQVKAVGLNHENLELEITEGMLVENATQTSKNLTLLSEMGVSIALDDFGVGYSSMVYLLKYPQISTLKIDCKFVWEMEKNARNLAILKSIIDLGHALNMRIVAEGVETPRQFELLNHYGCENFQGYLVSPAIAAENWQEQAQGWHDTIATLTK
ncbi:EAL domain-containing protein [Colwellia sp. C1TZA3]|uniref:EAL domain-containing protein n=1 Tax=Colwellia sp. C1TZA3 TaxID=2508879 RepID=UPI0011B96ECB|nr:EAL domain-containing protein [Colwellia sp. C1TZA3]TWX73512.1 EAL domain-containing protein [Colwellia sp. C1TZA3]